MDWLLVVELVAAVVLLAFVAPICWLILRRRWLSRGGGVFDCSLRLRTTVPDSGWVLGLARYRADRLEWYRAFSLTLRPRKVFRRVDTTTGLQRSPTPVESVLLFADQRIITLTSASRGSWELSMSVDSLTGLLSWLEAAPPGEGHQVGSWPGSG